MATQVSAMDLPMLRMSFLMEVHLLFQEYGVFSASSENVFLMIGTRDCVTNEAMEIPKYFVYYGIFIVRSCGTRSGQIAKGTFSEVHLILACQSVFAGQFVAEPMDEYYKFFVNDV